MVVARFIIAPCRVISILRNIEYFVLFLHLPWLHEKYDNIVDVRMFPRVFLSCIQLALTATRYISIAPGEREPEKSKQQLTFLFATGSDLLFIQQDFRTSMQNLQWLRKRAHHNLFCETDIYSFVLRQTAVFRTN